MVQGRLGCGRGRTGLQCSVLLTPCALLLRFVFLATLGVPMRLSVVPNPVWFVLVISDPLLLLIVLDPGRFGYSTTAAGGLPFRGSLLPLARNQPLF